MNDAVKTPRSTTDDQSGAKVKVSTPLDDATKPPKYPGIKTVIHGNGAVAHVMGNSAIAVDNGLDPRISRGTRTVFFRRRNLNLCTGLEVGR